MIRQLVIDTIKDNIIDRYCDFSGTISRGAFWRFMLVEHLIVGVCLAVLGLLSLHSALFIYTIGIVFALWFISIMALTLPNLGAMVRRLHDTNNSEWLLLLGVYSLYRHSNRYIALSSARLLLIHPHLLKALLNPLKK
ncbi:MAG: DUF805 domain-containing protein [Veillonella atypica]